MLQIHEQYVPTYDIGCKLSCAGLDGSLPRQPSLNSEPSIISRVESFDYLEDMDPR